MKIMIIYLTYLSIFLYLILPLKCQEFKLVNPIIDYEKHHNFWNNNPYIVTINNYCSFISGTTISIIINNINIIINYYYY